MRRNYLLSVYVDKDTYERLKEIAQREERTISYLVNKILREHLGSSSNENSNEKREEKEIKSQETKREEVKSKKPFSFVIDF